VKHRGASTAAVFSFVFVCFFPNPALPIGSNTGLQAGEILAVLSAPAFLLLGWLPRRHLQVLLLLLSPPFLAGYLSVLTGRALSEEVVINNLIATSLVMVVLVPAGGIVKERWVAPLLSGAAAAILCHALVGIYQVYWFARDVFPLAGLYQNPSFLSLISEEPSDWALYVKRPCGLFPEPSAMAASTGPWLIFFFGLLMYPGTWSRATRGVRVFLALALAGGAGLILLSRSGYTLFLLAGFLLAGLPAVKDAFLRLHRPKGLLTVTVLVLAGVAVTVLSIVYLSARVESEVQGGSSWPLRFASIVLGLKYLATSLPDLLVGAGPGQSSLILQSSGAAGSGLGGETGAAAVWSVVVTYVQEAGLVGAAALTVALITVLRAVAASSAPLVGLSCLMAWLGGVVFTTSYLSLLPLWIFFALLLGWDCLLPRSRLGRTGPETAVP
jgi:hypothetical protein